MTTFSRWSKLEETQLVWRFRRVKRSSVFPLGVQTTYKAFAQDKPIEIVADDEVDSILRRCEGNILPFNPSSRVMHQRADQNVLINRSEETFSDTNVESGRQLGGLNGSSIAETTASGLKRSNNDIWSIGYQAVVTHSI